MSEPTLRVQELQAVLDGELSQCRQRLQALLWDVERFSEPLPEGLRRDVLLLFDVYCVKFLSECRMKAGAK